MALFQKLLDFYINSSIHVALAVYAFVRITEQYFGLSYNEPLDYFIFYGTITGYNFVKYAGVAKLHHRSLTAQLKIIQLFSLACFLLLCYYAWQLSVTTLYVLAPFGLLTFLYAVPLFGGFRKNLRNISYLKIVVVALVWAGVTVVLPIYDAGVFIDSKVGLATIQRFLLVTVLILPFDIRDVKYDAISLQTIPKKIGIPQTKKLGYFLLMLCLVLEFMIAPTPEFRRLFFLIFIVIAAFLMRAKVEQSKYYSSFWVEAIPVFWWMMLG